MKFFFRLAAIFDWVAAFNLLFNLDLQVKMLGLETPNYPGIFNLVGGVTFIFGWTFWQVAKDPSNKPLFQAALLAKIVPFFVISSCVFFGKLPRAFFPIVFLTDGMWVFPFLYFYYQAQPRRRRIFVP